MLSSVTPQRGALLLLLAARNVGTLRTAIFSPDEARDEHGRWTKGGGFTASPSDALGDLASGLRATVAREDVRATVLKAAKGAGPIDLTNLSVEGTPLFVGGLNRARDTMPQIPKEYQAAFLASVREQGVTVTNESVKPTSLLPTQNEIDAVRVGQKLAAYDKGQKTLRPIMVSKDDYVLDGHHRWAVETIVAFDSPKANVKVPVIRLGVGHEKALGLMLDYTKSHKITNRALGDVAGHEFHGNQWTSGGGTAAADTLNKDGFISLKHFATPVLTNTAPLVDAKVEKGEYAAQTLDLTTTKLKTEQESIGTDKTKSIITKWDRVVAESEPPRLAKNKETGELTITDGNHRVAAALLRGEKSIKVQVVTLPASKFRTASANRDQTPLHRAADSQVSKIEVAFRYAFAKGRKALGSRGNVDAAVRAVRQALESVLPQTLLKALVTGGQAAVVAGLRTAELRTAKGPQQTPSLVMRFDPTNEAASAWAQEHAAELIDDISATTEQAIRDAVVAAQEGDGLDAQYDDILAAVGDEARAALIARTESMTAANEGQRQAWDQAVEAGLLTGDERRTWIATSDACPLCDALDGETADLNGEYPGDGGDGPPLHPNCRCTEGIVG